MPPSSSPAAANGPDSAAAPPLRPRRARAGLVLGIAALLIMLALPAPAGLASEAWRVAAVAALMTIWWVSEAIPVTATGLVPLVLFPVLGVMPMEANVRHYADPVIFLFLGGFVIAAAMERWNLHRRIALQVIRLAGTGPAALVGGFMAASAAVSMWVSNTATTIMMLPIALSVIALVEQSAGNPPGPRTQDGRFAPALLLSVAYAASIGGVATLVGTPPNAVAAAYLSDQLGIRIGFLQWMLFGVPLSVAMLAVSWVVLTRWLFPLDSRPLAGVAARLEAELAALGPVSHAESLTACVFAVVALAWVARPALTGLLPGLPLSDSGIAVTGALALFLIPVDWRAGRFLLDADWAARIPWGILILFGGGLSLAAGIADSGLSAAIGKGLEGAGALPFIALIAVVALVVAALTEFMTNTAVTIIFLPVAAALAREAGVDPVAFVVPAAAAASYAFMFPVSTPPNAIVFGSGRITLPQMAGAGLVLDLVGVGLITLAVYALGDLVFGR